LLLGLPLIAALALATPERARSPWFLPRYAMIGAYAGTGVFAPTARIGWELGVVEQRTEFVLLLELGPAFAVAVPKSMRTFFEHSALVGVGLRNQRGKQFHWGISLLTGPMYEGATFVDGTLNEERWNGAIEGRLQGGIDLGPVSLAGYFGYQGPYLSNFHFASTQYIGGFSFGVLLNWR
jgi:hypothetical protein